MRWLYHDPADRREAAERKRTLAAIDRWWAAFTDRAADVGDLFRGKKKWDLVAWMHDTLQAVSPDLCWEYGPAVNQSGHRLVITPESHKELRPLTATILERAPTIPGWEFYPYRLAEGLDMAVQSVKGGRRDAGRRGRRGPPGRGESDRPDVPVADDRRPEDEGNNAAFVATESLLGEECLVKWVGVIEVGPRPKRAKKPGDGVPLDRLKDRVDAMIESIRDRLPDRPYHERMDGAEWTGLQFQPEPADDYPERSDIFVARTADLELWKAQHRGSSFYPERFSRCGESFAYVKFERAVLRPGHEVDDRTEIEEALDAALAPAGLGAHIGAGMGIMYAYIDLALTDQARGVEAVRQTLRARELPERTWVLFFDADLCGEWVGVYPETPAPPTADEE